MDIGVAKDGPELSRKEILKWVSNCACAVSSYYGRFPVRKVRLEIVPVDAKPGFITGTTFVHNDDAVIRIAISRLTTGADLHKDWVLTHEMVHLAFPSVVEAHHWIEEGIATYVEPIGRVEAGNLDVETVWQELVEGLPQGLPQPGDRGLDYTHTWGRTYWGGALFCLFADVEIRQATANKYGLQDALRAIVSVGGNIQQAWPLAQALRVGDEAVGTPVLTRLYNQMKATPITPDLRALWKQLGVVPATNGVVFDNHAPLAALRQAITNPSSLHSGCAWARSLRPQALSSQSAALVAKTGRRGCRSAARIRLLLARTLRRRARDVTNPIRIGLYYQMIRQYLRYWILRQPGA